MQQHDETLVHWYLRPSVIARNYFSPGKGDALHMPRLSHTISAQFKSQFPLPNYQGSPISLKELPEGMHGQLVH